VSAGVDLMDVIKTEDGRGITNELEVVEGMQFDRGFLSPYFINDAEKQRVVLGDACVPRARPSPKASDRAAASRSCVRRVLDDMHAVTLGQRAGISILRRALEEPLRQIAENAGQEPAIIVGKVSDGEGNFGYDAATEQYGDRVAMRIIDPTKVTRLGLQNAASIANLILTTDCVIVERARDRIATRDEAAGGLMREG